MKLLIDIGNTNTSMALLGGDKIRKRFFVRTLRKDISRTAFKRLFGGYTERIDSIVIVSVVPQFLKIMKTELKSVFPKIKLMVVGKDIIVPIKNRYKYPEEVGQDRLVISFSALEKVNPPFVVIDFGSAVTLDYVNKKREYEGGLIFPGLRLALQSLVKDAALLPAIALRSTKDFTVGKDTKGSMNNGILFGYAAMCDGLIEKLRKKYGKNLKILATGGDAPLVAKYSHYITNIYPDLIFDGLKTL